MGGRGVGTPVHCGRAGARPLQRSAGATRVRPQQPRVPTWLTGVRQGSSACITSGSSGAEVCRRTVSRLSSPRVAPMPYPERAGPQGLQGPVNVRPGRPTCLRVTHFSDTLSTRSTQARSCTSRPSHRRYPPWQQRVTTVGRRWRAACLPPTVDDKPLGSFDCARGRCVPRVSAPPPRLSGAHR